MHPTSRPRRLAAVAVGLAGSALVLAMTEAPSPADATTPAASSASLARTSTQARAAIGGASSARRAAAHRIGVTKPEPLLPDMTALRAVDLSIQHVSGGRQLRFEGDLANIGQGPLELVTNRRHPCPQGERHASQVIYRDVDGNHHFKRSVDSASKSKSAGCFLFHVEHNHWHFDAAARYRLFKPGAKGYISQSRKVSFCLRDSIRVPSSFGDFHQGRYYGDCSLDRPEGISVGWADSYESFLSGQSLHLPSRVRNGVYCLSIKVDPKGLLYESDEDNNISYRAFRIRGTTGLAPAQNSVCERTTPNAG